MNNGRGGYKLPKWVRATIGTVAILGLFLIVLLLVTVYLPSR